MISYLVFGRKLVSLILNRATMNTMINFLKALVNTLTFSKEQMPALIPVRVITKVHPINTDNF